MDTKETIGVSSLNNDPNGTVVGEVLDGVPGDGDAVLFVSDDVELTSSGSPVIDQAPEQGALIDSAGDVFDPSIHMADRDGTPKYTKTGRFRKRRRVSREAEPAEPERDSRYVQAASATVAAVEMIGVMLGGDDFRYRSDKKAGIDERASGIEVFAAYYEEKGIDDIPVGIGLAVWAIAYAAPRFAIPRVRERFGWVKAPFRWLARKVRG